MIRHLLLGFGILSIGIAGLSAPAFAQANDRTLVIFGNDRCPSGTICIRKSEGDRFRIPKDLRDTNSPSNQRWGDRAKSIDNVGASGTGSCSAAGAGGWTGCFGQQMRTYKQDRAADAKAASNEPQ